MERKLKTFVEKLKQLSSDELQRSIEEIAQSERRHTVCVIVHLVEIKRRNLHLERGYTSLFEYCVRDLRLSEGSVHCRIQVANVALRFPQVLARTSHKRSRELVSGADSPSDVGVASS